MMPDSVADNLAQARAVVARGRDAHDPHPALDALERVCDDLVLLEDHGALAVEWIVELMSLLQAAGAVPPPRPGAVLARLEQKLTAIADERPALILLVEAVTTRLLEEEQWRR